jgi:hypothetical protein
LIVEELAFAVEVGEQLLNEEPDVERKRWIEKWERVAELQAQVDLWELVAVSERLTEKLALAAESVQLAVIQCSVA